MHRFPPVISSLFFHFRNHPRPNFFCAQALLLHPDQPWMCYEYNWRIFVLGFLSVSHLIVGGPPIGNHPWERLTTSTCDIKTQLLIIIQIYWTVYTKKKVPRSANIIHLDEQKEMLNDLQIIDMFSPSCTLSSPSTVSFSHFSLVKLR